MEKEEYFFYEWLIIGKGYTFEQFENITVTEFEKLKQEYKMFCNTLKKLNL